MVAVADQLLRAREVFRQLAVSQASFYRMLRDGRFPPGTRLGPGIIRWRQSQVNDWLAKVGK